MDLTISIYSLKASKKGANSQFSNLMEEKWEQEEIEMNVNPRREVQYCSSSLIFHGHPPALKCNSAQPAPRPVPAVM